MAILRYLELKYILNKYNFCNKVRINIKNNGHFFDYIIIATCSSEKHIYSTTLDFISILKSRYSISSSVEGLLYKRWVIINLQNYSINFFLQNEIKKYKIYSLYKKK